MNDDSQTGDNGEGLNKNHATYLVPGLQRGLNVLEIVAGARKPLTVTEIAEQLGVTVRGVPLAFCQCRSTVNVVFDVCGVTLVDDPPF